MKKHLQHYWVAQSFLTRLPVPISEQYNDKQIGRSVLYYPVVGFIIALLLSVCAWLLSYTNQPLLVAAIICALWVIITGALHLDGLADSADAWLGGHGDKERIFTIMKDPRSGTAGVSAIVLIVLLKVTALSALLEADNWQILFFAPIIARLGASALIFLLPTAKQEGLAYTVKQNLPISDISVMLLFLSVVLLWFNPLIFILSIFVLLLLKWMIIKQIGGITGDTLGATIEIIEVSALVFTALLSLKP